jgi:hypothetical protein
MHARTHHPRGTPQQDRHGWQPWHLMWNVVVVAALGLSLATSHPVQAKTFQCGAGDVACLIAAINEANANGQMNTIRLEAGTYTLTAVDSGDPFQFDTNGLPVITSTLTITGAGAATTSIERGVSAPDFRLVHVAAAGTLTLRGLTLSGGGFSFAGNGGGILNNGTLTLSHSTLSNNRAGTEIGNGGGLFNEDGIATILNSTVAHNSAEGLVGGGISSGGLLVISHSTITDNSAFSGGGIVSGATLRITHSTIARNTSRFDAGGIVHDGTLTVTNSTIADNSGDVGGIQQNGGALIVTNTTFSGNFLSGLHVQRGTAVLINTTFSRNSQGLANDTGQVILVNTILASNVQDCNSRPGPFTSLGDNLIGDSAGCTITLQASDLTGDPGLDAFTDDGRPGHGYFPLLSTSQAIDAGSDAVCPRRDQLGQRRIGPCDIGAIAFRDQDDRRQGEDPEAVAQESR